VGSSTLKTRFDPVLQTSIRRAIDSEVERATKASRNMISTLSRALYYTLMGRSKDGKVVVGGDNNSAGKLTIVVY